MVRLTQNSVRSLLPAKMAQIVIVLGWSNPLKSLFFSGTRAAQQSVMKNKQTEMKTTQNKSDLEKYNYYVFYYNLCVKTKHIL